MTDLSTITEPQIVRSKDGKTAVKYTVVKETIDLEALKAEKESLEAQLNEKEPSESELINLGRASHPFYMIDKASIKARIAEINKLLGR